MQCNTFQILPISTQIRIKASTIKYLNEGFSNEFELELYFPAMLIFRRALDSPKRCLQSQMKFLAQATWMLLPQHTRRQADTRIRLKTLPGHVYVNGKNPS